MKTPTHIKMSISIMALVVIIGFQTHNGYAFFTGVLGLICAQFWLDIALRINVIKAQEARILVLEKELKDTKP